MREFEIERQYGIKIESIRPNKGVYLLKTDDGTKCLKKISYGTQKLLFVYGAKEHLVNNGFDKLDRYFLNTEGNPYALVNEDIYTLSTWIDGRECDFHNEEDLVRAAKELAYMHIASKGYDPPENSKLKTDLGRWPHLMEKRVKSFDKMLGMIRKKKNFKTDFDMNYIRSMESQKELGKRAMAILDDSRYFDICRQTEEEKGLCHHDYTYHNIIIDKNNDFNIIDFDYCKREVKAFDLSNFLIKMLKKQDWDIKYAVIVLEAYSSVNPLSLEEYRLIYAFLVFPQRYWRLCNRYYYNEVTWIQNTFNKKMEELISEKEKFMVFIEDYKKTFNQR